MAERVGLSTPSGRGFAAAAAIEPVFSVRGFKSQRVEWPDSSFSFQTSTLIYGGEGGIRTHGKIAPTSDFESGAFNHSATSPKGEKIGPDGDL